MYGVKGGGLKFSSITLDVFRNIRLNNTIRELSEE